MKPISVNPKITFTQLFDELGTITDGEALPELIQQLLAKLQQKRPKLNYSSKRGQN